MVAATSAVDLGTVARGDLSGFNHSKVPTILVETGFMSNPIEDRLLASPHYQDKVAEGIAEGVIAYLESTSVATMRSSEPMGVRAPDGSAPLVARPHLPEFSAIARIATRRRKRHNGRLTQRESATFTRWKSLVQIQYRPPDNEQVRGHKPLACFVLRRPRIRCGVQMECSPRASS